MVTRLPDCSFPQLSRARTGGKVVSFDPNYSATAEKSTEWVRHQARHRRRVRTGGGQGDHRRRACSTSRSARISPTCRCSSTRRRGSVIVAAQRGRACRRWMSPAYREHLCGRGTQRRAFRWRWIPSSLGGTDGLRAGSALSTCRWRVARTVSREDLASRCCARAWTRTTWHSPRAPSPSVPADTIQRIARECAAVKPMHIIFGGSAHAVAPWRPEGARAARCSPRSRAISASSAAASPRMSASTRRASVTASWFIPPRHEARTPRRSITPSTAAPIRCSETSFPRSWIQSPGRGLGQSVRAAQRRQLAAQREGVRRA